MMNTKNQQQTQAATATSKQQQPTPVKKSRFPFGAADDGSFDELMRDINRSSSAPPTQQIQQQQQQQSASKAQNGSASSLRHEITEEIEDVRANPDYAAYFHSNARLDPRLPPPIYEPGQSWQLWSTSSGGAQHVMAAAPATAPVDGGNQQQGQQLQWVNSSRPPTSNGVIGNQRATLSKDGTISASSMQRQMSAESAPPARRFNFHEVIQQEFPRAASPVFSAAGVHQSGISRSGSPALQHKNDLHQLRLSSKTPPPPGLFAHAPHLAAFDLPRSSSTPPTASHLASVKYGKSVAATAMGSTGVMGGSGGDNLYAVDGAGDQLYLDDQILVDSMRNVGIIDEGHDAVNRQPRNAPAPQAQPYPTADYSQHYQSQSPQVVSHHHQQQQQFGNYGMYAHGMQSPRSYHHHSQQQQHQYSAEQQYYAGSTSPHMGRSRTPIESKNKSRAQSPHPVRSQLLEEFRVAHKSRRYELADIKGHVVEFCADQHGSRLIQQKLESASIDDRNKIFAEILPFSLSLMTDVFGNYVIQKYFEVGTPSQMTSLVSAMSGHVVTLALQMYGCRVVQKALEYSSQAEQSQLVHELIDHVTDLVKDQNGNHVIQKAIEVANAKDIVAIIDSFHGQVFPLATHTYGCRVMQRIFEHCNEQLTRPLVHELSGFTQTLVQDQYGNYVIQHILERGTAQDRANVLTQVRGQIFHLSKHKFASNVIEKCVMYSSEQGRMLIINELLMVPSSANGKQQQADPLTMPMLQMMKDQFGNYVIQKLFEVATRPQLDLIVSKIKPHVNAIRKFTYGKHILSKLEMVAGRMEWLTVSNAAAAANEVQVNYVFQEKDGGL